MPMMSAEETAALDRVRRRVAALAFFAVIVHGVLGLVGAAHVVAGQGRQSDAVGLLVMSGLTATIMYVGIRLILGARLFSPLWMLAAAAPTVVGFVWIA
ncbi:hypothetical protein ACHAAC_14215 [Aeromicrobium sp. CF4.19]|uniref:hypothetical protein n=1 Tax=Aeromicrobium sp. CF4.19 TaxID=3373082 RepID=UPI003EE74820